MNSLNIILNIASIYTLNCPVDEKYFYISRESDGFFI